MQILRTPDDRFADLSGWTFAPHYAAITDPDGTVLRLHYVDEGPSDGPVVLLMHGEPTWSYLYRNIIPGLVARGCRVLAPDLIGFGRSDKPASRSDYTYERHVAWMSDWLTGQNLNNVTLFCQDWGGLIGLRLVAAFPDVFSGLVISNTGLPIGIGWSEDFAAWLEYSQNAPELPIGSIVNGGAIRELSPSEVAAYDAPFPDESYKEGARQFPALVPVTPEHASVAENIAAWKALAGFHKPVLTAFSDSDEITRGGDAIFQSRMPGADGQAHVTLRGGHFVQEDSPYEIVDLILSLAAR